MNKHVDWSVGLAREFAFPAEMFMAAGAHYVIEPFDELGTDFWNGWNCLRY